MCAPLICGAGVAWVSSFYNHAPVLFLQHTLTHAGAGDLKWLIASSLHLVQAAVCPPRNRGRPHGRMRTLRIEKWRRVRLLH